MTGFEIGGLIYLIVGLLFGAISWMALSGEIDGTNPLLNDAIRASESSSDPKTRLRMAVAKILVPVGAVLLWPALLIYAMVLASRKS